MRKSFIFQITTFLLLIGLVFTTASKIEAFILPTTNVKFKVFYEDNVISRRRVRPHGPVDRARLYIRIKNLDGKWVTKTSLWDPLFTDENGEAILKDVPVGATLEVTAFKSVGRVGRFLTKRSEKITRMPEHIVVMTIFDVNNEREKRQIKNADENRKKARPLINRDAGI